jgi:predicted permease
MSLESVLLDVRYELRTLIKSPRFSIVALVTLALGVAASVAIFTFVNATLIQPLPYREPSRLVALNDARNLALMQKFEASYPDFLDWRSKNDVFDALAGYVQTQVGLRGESTPELLAAAKVTDNFFSTLGVRPVVGRDFRPGEDLASAAPTILITYGWWQKRFGGKQEAIGQSLVLEGSPATIIGVLPKNFHFAAVGDPVVWLTTRPRGDALQRRNLHWLNPIGRLRAGVSLEMATAEMNVIEQQLEKQYPQSIRDLRVVITPLNEVLVGQVRPILLMLLGVVGALLLIACANIANLLLARSVGRRNEFAVRAALGATRGRLIALMLTEGLVLSCTGTLVGLVAAYALVKGLVSMIPPEFMDAMPYLKLMTIDARVGFFTAALAVFTGVVFALAPAWRAAGAEVQPGLKESSRGSQPGSWRRVSSVLIVGEVALATVLLAGSGLLMKSLYRLLRVDPGFETTNLLSLSVSLPGMRYQQGEEQLAARHAVIDRVRALPGVISVGSSDMLPISNGGNTVNIRVLGDSTNQEHEANVRDADSTYFQTLHAELLMGRWFTPDDNVTAPKRVIVNKTFADSFMKDLDPLKQQVVFTFSPTQRPREVVGVIRDIKEGPLDIPARPALYIPMDADPDTFFSLVVRTGQNPGALADSVVSTVRSFDPGALVLAVQTMEDRIQRSPAAFFHRYPAVLAAGFALLALVLGSTGLYALVAYSVSRRTQEFGIRMALGAQRTNVLRMVVAEGLRLVVPGVVGGIVGAVFVCYLMSNLLFGTKPWDPFILGMVTALLAMVTLCASYAPASAATKVDPMVALRYE